MGVESSPPSPVLAQRRSPRFKKDSRYALLDYTLSYVDSLQSFLTFAQFNSRSKFCLYTIAHLLLEEYGFSLKSSLTPQSVCHTLCSGVGA